MLTDCERELAVLYNPTRLLVGTVKTVTIIHAASCK